MGVEKESTRVIWFAMDSVKGDEKMPLEERLALKS